MPQVEEEFWEAWQEKAMKWKGFVESFTYSHKPLIPELLRVFMLMCTWMPHQKDPECSSSQIWSQTSGRLVPPEHSGK